MKPRMFKVYVTADLLRGYDESVFVFAEDYDDSVVVARDILIEECQRVEQNLIELESIEMCLPDPDAAGRLSGYIYEPEQSAMKYRFIDGKYQRLTHDQTT